MKYPIYRNIKQYGKNKKRLIKSIPLKPSDFWSEHPIESGYYRVSWHPYGTKLALTLWDQDKKESYLTLFDFEKDITMVSESLSDETESLKDYTLIGEKDISGDGNWDDFGPSFSPDGKTILFATGTKWRKLEVPGSMEFENKGIFYCALCDSPMYKNKITAVVGGSDSAAKDALVLAEHAKKVFIIIRKDNMTAEPVNVKRIAAKKNIEIINNANIVEIKGDSRLRKIILDREFNGKKELDVDGLLVDIGHIPLSDLAKKLGVKTNNHNEIVIDHRTSETNVPGVFAAGDVADKPFKQAITGVAEGCTAAYSAFEYLKRDIEE